MKKLIAAHRRRKSLLKKVFGIHSRIIVEFAMSSSLENLFGNVSDANVESNVSKLFGKSSGPVDKNVVNARKRTVLPELPAEKDESASESASEEEPVQERESESKEEAESEHEQEQESESESESGSESEPEPEPKPESESEPEHQHKKRRKDEDDGLEEKYFAKLMDQEPTEEHEHEHEEKKQTKQEEKPQEGAKAIDLKEDEFEKAERTVFVGNVPAEVVSNKSLSKQFKKIFQDENGIESIRFRSISFELPLPRKVAFVQQKLHKSRGSVNAYVVYKQRKSVFPICSRLNAQVFSDRHLRVDSVTHPAKHDNKRSVFVGNLDFEEDEENLWRHFGSCGEIEYVRIIRDPKTNVGKGFAYVQFKDFPNVNKALLLNDRPLESSGKSRKLRVTRCKNLKKSNNGLKSFKDTGVLDKLSDSRKTKLGRAKRALNKADAAQVGREITVEGLRASKADSQPSAVLKKRKKRSKSGRVTKRSQAHRKTNKKND